MRARVDNPEARRYGAFFSVGARVLAYEMRNSASPEFFAEITAVELTEISLTDVPANPNAILLSRRRVAPEVEFYGHAADAMRFAQKIVARMRDMVPREGRAA